MAAIDKSKAEKPEGVLGESSAGMPKGASEEKLDDIMLAMDVVDTLRHEQNLVARDLAVEDRRQNLIKRLRRIYDAQGIEVADRVLMDGVLALEEERFAFVPPKKSFGLKLAALYIGRKKWLPLIYTVGFILGSASLINYVGFVRPSAQKASRIERQLSQTLPQALLHAKDRAVAIAANADLKNQAELIFATGMNLIAQKDIKGAETAVTRLTEFAEDLEQSYTVQIVSEADEYSGVFRVNDEAGAETVRNYYLIVEAIDPLGQRLKVRIKSEEDRATDRVSRWGVRVPESVFNAVAADKTDDRIIQNAVIGKKTRGRLNPEFSVETSNGYILDW